MPGNVQSVTPSFGDKVFEPVVSLRRDQSEEQAATLASESRFSLGAAIVTANIRKARNLAEQRIKLDQWQSILS
ncbi:aldehyde dehydrogenase family protein [Synechococcus sp. MIT S9451]|uniref:aldehyde dehydrogenase family protein n=1 Tax=Synechococcus sp. MIT S9451 TaxID=3082543 RepID=UPI0039B5A435